MDDHVIHSNLIRTDSRGQRVMKRVWKVTGRAASPGIPGKHTIALLPKTVAGQKIDYVVLDHATDSRATILIVGD